MISRLGGAVGRETKLAARCETLVPEAGDADWVLAHVRPLLGLGAEERADDRRTEAFAAWRRFFEALAERGPRCWFQGPPLGRRRSARLRRPPRRVGPRRAAARRRDGAARAARAEARLGRRQGEGLDRVAEPAVRRADRTPRRACSTRRCRRRAPDDVARPRRREPALRGGVRPACCATRTLRGRAARERCQGLIAARLDALSADEKVLIQDAAVIGKVFWAGGVAVLGDVDQAAVVHRLHQLERKEFIRRERRGSIAAEHGVRVPARARARRRVRADPAFPPSGPSIGVRPSGSAP